MDLQVLHLSGDTTCGFGQLLYLAKWTTAEKSVIDTPADGEQRVCSSHRRARDHKEDMDDGTRGQEKGQELTWPERDEIASEKWEKERERDKEKERERELCQY